MDEPAVNLNDAGNCFRLALCMSGAISAGAYTAGVIDFLIQALAEWEIARHRSPGIAIHGVRIVAMSGASAGGMTAAMTAVSLAHGLDYDSYGLLKIHERCTSTGDIIKCVMPRLYEAWVTKPGMVTEPGTISLLSLEDLEDCSLTSLLNSKVLDSIVAGVFAPSHTPAPSQNHEFLADPLHLYLMHTNLRGIPYDIKFQSDEYHMLDHADRRHFKITGIGGMVAGQSLWAALDPGLKLDGGVNPKLSPPEDWQQLGLAALATGAFPGGLAPRVIYDLPSNYAFRQWPAPDRHSAAILPDFPPTVVAPPISTFGFVNVDGGLINNDPFEFARYCLLDDWNADHPQNPRPPEKAHQAVIMISPFPEGYSFPVNDPLDTGIVAALKKLLPTLIQQARFKPDDLAAAADPKIASRWLIAPKLTVDGAPTSANIACGALSGFGGFLSLQFREHDFQLGRRNCQQFLRESFSLPHGARIKFKPEAPKTQKKEYQIIPLYCSAEDEVPLLSWPRMSASELDMVLQNIRKRANAVIQKFLNQDVHNILLRYAFYIAWYFKRAKLMKLIEKIIIENLRIRNQI